MGEEQVYEFVTKTKEQIKDLLAFIESARNEVENQGVNISLLRRMSERPEHSSAIQEVRERTHKECDQILGASVRGSFDPKIIQQNSRGKRSRILI